MTLIIDKFSLKYQKAIKEFILERFKEFGFPYEKVLDYDIDNLEEHYKKNGGIFYVLKDENNIIGTIGIMNRGDGIAELKRLYVKQEYRGKGFGAMLVDKAVEFCKINGFKKIKLETNKVFKIAHQIYLKKGFQIVKEDNNDYYMELLW